MNRWTMNRAAIDQAPKHPKVHYDEAKIPAYTLPDLLSCGDGKRATTAQQWETQVRPRTLELFAEQMFGRAPAAMSTRFEVLETSPRAAGGAATRRLIRITVADSVGRSFSFPFSLLTPNHLSGQRLPCAVLINNRQPAVADARAEVFDDFWPAETILNRGYATAVFRTWDVDADAGGVEARAGGVRAVWPAGGATSPDAGDAWGTIAAWAWGASRIMDYLQTDSTIDAGKVMLIGHSRGGKTALWASAVDPRFAIAVSNESGCGGAQIARRGFGETIPVLIERFDYWFCRNFARYAAHFDQMPFDMHQLIALSAPRAVAIGSADINFWADPYGEFLGLAHASEVFGLYGGPRIATDDMPGVSEPLNRGPMHYHIRPGDHDLLREDWKHYLDFAARVFSRVIV